MEGYDSGNSFTESVEEFDHYIFRPYIFRPGMSAIIFGVGAGKVEEYFDLTIFEPPFITLAVGVLAGLVALGYSLMKHGRETYSVLRNR